jgi:hypothetical protein
LDPEDDLSTRAVALRALKEIEFDRATGKLADADYDALKQRYTAEALEAAGGCPAAFPRSCATRPGVRANLPHARLPAGVRR